MVTIMTIHPTAIVSDDAAIGSGSVVGPYSVIEDGVIIGENCSIAAHVILRRGSVLGNEVTVDSFAVISGNPQSLTFDASIQSGVRIGDGTVIREGCTIHRASSEGGNTVISGECFLMAQAHVAHDCELGSGVVLANNVMLAGHIEVGAKTFIGGGAGIHQYCRIGAFAMVAGNASITADIPPYTMVSERNSAHGLNLIGLRRGGFERAEIADLKQCYRMVYIGDKNVRKKAAEILKEGKYGTTRAGEGFLRFFEQGNRGFAQSETRAK
ncbi:MAG: UDP-N-acetylglucosamine acyltransferase [Lentimonas sp.]|jgi:UDP-N-acetylglucosamine acyltransferase